MKDIKLNSKVVVANTYTLPDEYNRFLGQIGIVKIIDRLSVKNRIIFCMEFLDDANLNRTYYEECKVNNVIPCVPRKVKFFDYNVKDVS